MEKEKEYIVFLYNMQYIYFSLVTLALICM